MKKIVLYIHSASISSNGSGGRVTVRVIGYNLGANVDDIVMLSIRGVKCSTLRRESSNSLFCVSGHPALTMDNGEVGNRNPSDPIRWIDLMFRFFCRLCLSGGLWLILSLKHVPYAATKVGFATASIVGVQERLHRRFGKGISNNCLNRFWNRIFIHNFHTTLEASYISEGSIVQRRPLRNQWKNNANHNHVNDMCLHIPKGAQSMTWNGISVLRRDHKCIKQKQTLDPFSTRLFR